MSKQAIDQDAYLNECINKRLLLFIEKYHQNGDYRFWPNLASTHDSNRVLESFNEQNILYVIRAGNSLNPARNSFNRNSLDST